MYAHILFYIFTSDILVIYHASNNTVERKTRNIGIPHLTLYSIKIIKKKSYYIIF